MPRLLGLALALLCGALLAVPAGANAAGTPNLGLAADAPARVLIGGTANVTLTATNPSGQPYGYNLSFRDVLPAGVSYVANSAKLRGRVGHAPGDRRQRGPADRDDDADLAQRRRPLAELQRQADLPGPRTPRPGRTRSASAARTARTRIRRARTSTPTPGSSPPSTPPAPRRPARPARPRRPRRPPSPRSTSPCRRTARRASCCAARTTTRPSTPSTSGTTTSPPPGR